MAPYTGQVVKRRALALDETVKWLPLHDAYYLLAEVMTSTRAAPLVVMQEVLLQIEVHASSEVYGATCGILCGGVYRDPTSNANYLLVEGIERAARMDLGADPDASLAADLSRAIASAERAGRTVVGWYRFDVALSHRIPATDAGLHRALFPEVWQVALLRDGADGEGSGAFIRVEPTEGRAFPIPFLELIPHRRARGRSPKRTSVQWRNYTAEAPVVALPVEVFHYSAPGHAKKPAAPNNGASRGVPLAGVFARWSARRSAAAGLERPTIPRSPVDRVVERATAPPPRIDEEAPPPLHPGVTEPPSVGRPSLREESWSPPVLPAASEVPVVVPEKPIVREEPVVPEQPVVQEELIVAEEPAVAEELIVPEEPAVRRQPAVPAVMAPEERAALSEERAAVQEPAATPEEPAAIAEEPAPIPDKPVAPAEGRAWIAEERAAVSERAVPIPDGGEALPEPDDGTTIPDDPRTVIVERARDVEAPPSELEALFTEWRPGGDERAASDSFSLPRSWPVSGTAVKRGVAAVVLLGVAYTGVHRVRSVQASRKVIAAAEAPGRQDGAQEEAAGRLADAEATGRSSEGDFTPEQRAQVRSSLAHISESRQALVAHLDTLESALATSRDGTGEAEACARAGSAYQRSLDDLARIDLARKQLASLVGPMRMAGIDSLATIAGDLHPRLRNACPR